MKKLLLFILLVCATVQAYSQEYPKVVLSGDYPDPSVMRGLLHDSFSFLLRSRIPHLALP